MPRGVVTSMARSAFQTVLFLGLVAGGSVGVWYYQSRQSAAFQIHQLEQQKQKLEQEKKQLQTVVERLSDEKRIAEVIVTEQHKVGDQLRTSLLFVEYARDGTSLPPKHFTIDGNTAHLDAMVIKFERDFIAQDDPLRGHSIALFCRLYGEKQTPDAAFRIDAPGQIPDIYRGDAKQAASQAAFEKELWLNFWHLAEDKRYRETNGVRVANGQGIWGPFAPDKLYTISIESDGGLNLKEEPMKGIFREALRQKWGEPASPASAPVVSRND